MKSPYESETVYYRSSGIRYSKQTTSSIWTSKITRDLFAANRNTISTRRSSPSKMNVEYHIKDGKREGNNGFTEQLRVPQITTLVTTFELVPSTGRHNGCRSLVIVRPNLNGSGLTALRAIVSKTAVQTIGQVLCEFSIAFGPRWRNDPIRHLYSLSGREIRSIHELFMHQHKVLIGVGSEKLFTQSQLGKNLGSGKVNQKTSFLIDGRTIKSILSAFWANHPDPLTVISQWEQKISRLHDVRKKEVTEKETLPTDVSQARTKEHVQVMIVRRPPINGLTAADSSNKSVGDEQRDSGFEEIGLIENDSENTFQSLSTTDSPVFNQPVENTNRFTKLPKPYLERKFISKIINEQVKKFETLNASVCPVTITADSVSYSIAKNCGLGHSEFNARMSLFGSPAPPATATATTARRPLGGLTSHSSERCTGSKRMPPLNIQLPSLIVPGGAHAHVNKARSSQCLRSGSPKVVVPKLPPINPHSLVTIRDSHRQKLLIPLESKKLAHSSHGLETIIERTDRTCSDGAAEKPVSISSVLSHCKEIMVRPKAKPGITRKPNVTASTINGMQAADSSDRPRGPNFSQRKHHSNAENRQEIRVDRKASSKVGVERSLSDTVYESNGQWMKFGPESFCRGSLKLKQLQLQFIPEPAELYKRYRVGRVLGDGNFATVRLARCRDTGQKYAMKIIEKSKLKGREGMLVNEISIMHHCNHQNIVRLIEEFETPKEIWLIMEFVPDGDLFDGITKSVKYSEPVTAGIVSDLANALFYLHCRSIVHRDLKPENILISRQPDEKIRVKLADFGLAMEVTRWLYTICGTPTYIAPEILQERGYGLEVDMWALGVITYIMLCGFAPFRSPERRQSKLFESIKSGVFEFTSPYWDDVSHGAKDLVTRLLVVKPRNRLKAMDTLLHPWVLAKGGSIQSVVQKQLMLRDELMRQSEEVSRIRSTYNSSREHSTHRSDAKGTELLRVSESNHGCGMPEL